MHDAKRKSAGLECILLTTLLTIPPTAFADVTITQRYDMDAAGGMGMFASSGTIVTAVSGNKSRTDSDIQSKSALAKTFGAGGRTAEIIRLDKGMFYVLEPDKQQYAAIDMETRKQQLATGLNMFMGADRQAEGQDGFGGPDSSEVPVSQQNCVGVEPEVTVDSRGKEKIAGMKTKRSTIRVKQTCTDPQTGKACDFEWVMDQWLANKQPGGGEVEDFWTSYAAAMGLDAEMVDAVSARMQLILSAFRESWDMASDQVDDLKGYPVKSVIEMKIGGETCTNPQGMHISANDIFADMTSSATDAATDAAMDQAAEAMGGGMLGKGAKTLGKSMFGGFGKKKQESAETQTARLQPTVSLFRIVSETTAVSTETIPASHFETPFGWQRVAAP